MADKSPLKGHGQSHVTLFKFCGPNDICGTAKARVVKFCTQVDYIISYLKADKPPLKGAWSGHVTRYLPQSCLWK